MLDEREFCEQMAVFPNFRYYDGDGMVNMAVFGGVDDAKRCLRMLGNEGLILSTGVVSVKLMSSWVRRAQDSRC